jgi:hypothetical protein
MLRQRGRLRRGPAWHNFNARQRRRQQLEQALSIARSQRREKARTPPMAYVEEVIPEEPIQFPPESLLFIFLDNWKPPNQFPAGTSALDKDQYVREARDEYTCII